MEYPHGNITLYLVYNKMYEQALKIGKNPITTC